MVLTNAQKIAFFEEQAQMATPNPTRIRLQDEGITDVSDLIDFDKKRFKQVTRNLRCPGGGVPDSEDPEATAPTPPFAFGAKSQQRLLAACEIIRFCEEVGRKMTVGDIQWDLVIKTFTKH